MQQNTNFYTPELRKKTFPGGGTPRPLRSGEGTPLPSSHTPSPALSSPILSPRPRKS